MTRGEKRSLFSSSNSGGGTPGNSKKLQKIVGVPTGSGSIRTEGTRSSAEDENQDTDYSESEQEDGQHDFVPESTTSHDTESSENLASDSEPSSPKDE